jgi:DNA-binding NarL/FixJ family response regulator
VLWQNDPSPGRQDEIGLLLFVVSCLRLSSIEFASELQRRVAALGNAASAIPNCQSRLNDIKAAIETHIATLTSKSSEQAVVDEAVPTTSAIERGNDSSIRRRVAFVFSLDVHAGSCHL